MKEPKFNKNGTRQLVDTGWKEFDRQTNCITTGNAVCSTQMSTYIRPFSETECNGFAFRPGELLDADLKPYRKYSIPNSILETLEDKGRKNSMILYMFFTIPSRKLEAVPFFWVLTTREPHPNLIDKHVCLRLGERYTKRMSAATEILKYITEEDNEKE